MKLAIAYSTKDEVENSRQTLPRLLNTGPRFRGEVEVLWCDGSTSQEGIDFVSEWCLNVDYYDVGIGGGADAAIAWKLTKALQRDCTHVMLLENDVLLDEGWFEPTMELFEKGKADGLEVGAVSPRSFVDRVLIQRDGYAIMHNLGAGVVIFSRRAAEIVLQSFRTHWWPDNVRLFGSLAGVDLRTYAAFRGQEQWVTTDWGWDAQLASHGLASLALTPAKCQMIGQKIPMEQQGLRLTDGSRSESHDHAAWEKYCALTDNIRKGYFSVPSPSMIHVPSTGQLFFPHQLGAINARWQGDLELQWNQAFGPFTYRAGPDGASLSVRLSGTCSFLVGGGASGSSVTIEDSRSGFKANPSLPPVHQVTISVPGSPIPRLISMHMNEGAWFYGLQTADAQIIDTSFRFSWDQLPEAK